MPATSLPATKWGRSQSWLRLEEARALEFTSDRHFKLLGWLLGLWAALLNKGRRRAWDRQVSHLLFTNRRVKREHRRITLTPLLEAFLEAKLSIWKTRKWIIFCRRVQTKHEDKGIFSPSHSWQPCQEWTPQLQQNKCKGMGRHCPLLTMAQTPLMGTSTVERSYNQHHFPAQADTARLLWKKPSASWDAAVQSQPERGVHKSCSALRLWALSWSPAPTWESKEEKPKTLSFREIEPIGEPRKDLNLCIPKSRGLAGAWEPAVHVLKRILEWKRTICSLWLKWQTEATGRKPFLPVMAAMKCPALDATGVPRWWQAVAWRMRLARLALQRMDGALPCESLGGCTPGLQQHICASQPRDTRAWLLLDSLSPGPCLRTRRNHWQMRETKPSQKQLSFSTSTSQGGSSCSSGGCGLWRSSCAPSQVPAVSPVPRRVHPHPCCSTSPWQSSLRSSTNPDTAIQFVLQGLPDITE